MKRLVGLMMTVRADHPKECTLDLDNYLECLHHRKEVSAVFAGWLADEKKVRVQRVREEWMKQRKAGRLPAEGQLAEKEATSVVTRLGFIDGSSVAHGKESK